MLMYNSQITIVGKKISKIYFSTILRYVHFLYIPEANIVIFNFKLDEFDDSPF